MKARGILMWLLSFTLCAAAGAQTWEIQSPRPFTHTVACAAFPGGERGFAGGGDELLRTTDGGVTWALSCRTSDYPTGLSFVDEDYGWLVRGTDAPLRTTDGGLTWQAMPTGFWSNSVQACFTSHTNGWLIGTLVLHTTDGGVTWDSLHVWEDNGALNTNTACFTDSLHGWISIQWPPSVVRTTDGGATWQNTLIDTTFKWISDLCFVSSEQGFMTTVEYDHDERIDCSRILGTVDGGTTWSELYRFDRNYLWDIAFADALHGLVGASGAVLVTEDGGLTWMPRELPSWAMVSEVAATPSGYFWAFTDGAIALRSADFGQSWEHVPGGLRPSGWQAIHMADAQNGLAGGYLSRIWEGVIARTVDGGARWELAVIPHGTQTVWDVVLLPDGEGWAVAGGPIGDHPNDSGRLLHSDNGGRTWSVWLDEPWFPLTDLSFPDPEHGWMAGRRGVYHLNRQSRIWELQYDSASLTRLCFVDSLYGWAAREGLMVHTADGGQSWTSEVRVLGSELYTLVFADRLHGWAITEGQWGSQTTDGGHTWQAGPNISTDRALAIAFSDARHGTLSAMSQDGHEYVLWTTVNGGQIWERCDPIPLAGISPLSVLAPVGAAQGWGAGGGYLLNWSMPTAADPESAVPVPEKLEVAACPNPFNPTTRLEYVLPQAGRVRVTLYDMTGRYVRALVEGAQTAGTHRVTVDGAGLASGVYLARMECAGQSVTQKLLLLR